jgi:hypothetical protein
MLVGSPCALRQRRFSGSGTYAGNQDDQILLEEGATETPRSSARSRCEIVACLTT